MKNLIAVFVITILCMMVDTADAFDDAITLDGSSTHCLRVEVTKNLEILGHCWEHNGKYYNLIFEFLPAGTIQPGGLYWKLKTMTEATNCECDHAPVAQTGQEHSYSTGGDGNLKMGVPWPRPRFADHEDGTVTDNLTGLIWLKDAGCFTPELWDKALSKTNTLKSGECGLSDGSIAGDWRLPNVKELLSLINYNYVYPALSDETGNYQMVDGDPFTNVKNDAYWSSTTLAWGGGDLAWGTNAWYVTPQHGHAWWEDKKNYPFYIWPVRGGVKDLSE